VAYAVPSNGSTNATELGRTYDNYAKSYWQNFTYSLQQIPCDTESEARYSLATDCATCSEAYKQWLCGVTIPRCADYNSELEWLQPRNVGKQLPNGDIPPTQINSIEHQNSISTNSSRNSMIDDIIKPGPYKEIMPCGSLCYGLVQACPASLGFGCPGKDIRGGFNDTYRDHGGNSTSPHCNFPGAVWGVSGGTHLTPPSALALGAYAMITIWLYLSLGV
jgi:calcium channel MID1